MVGSEDRESLRFDGDFEFVVGDHSGVVGKGIRPEQLSEDLQHLGLAPEVDVERCSQPRWVNGEDRYRPGAHLPVLVLTDLNGCQVGCHRFGLLVDPRRLTRTGLLADQLAVGEGIERGIGGDRDSVRRFWKSDGRRSGNQDAAPLG